MANLLVEPERAVIGDLRALWEEEKNSDTPITPRAFSAAMALLDYVVRVLGDMPRPWLVLSSEGGITIEWLRDDRTVRVVIPPTDDQVDYIYERVGRESDIKPLSESSVVQSLRSLILMP